MKGETQDPGIPERANLMRMASAYLARYAASSQRVRQVLERRIQRRCRMSDREPPDAQALGIALDEVIQRLQQLGLLDDAAFSTSRRRALERKGLPRRRVRMALQSEGLDASPEGIDEDVPEDIDQARRYAARKRLGPFRSGERSAYRDKDLRSLLRAGFSFGIAVAVVDAETEDGP